MFFCFRRRKNVQNRLLSRNILFPYKEKKATALSGRLLFSDWKLQLPISIFYFTSVLLSGALHPSENHTEWQHHHGCCQCKCSDK